MKEKAATKKRKSVPPDLRPLRRAAKKAVELARLTGTPAYVWENGRIVDIAKRQPQDQKDGRQA